MDSCFVTIMTHKTIHRKEAIQILEEAYFKNLPIQERLETLEELWISCDSEEWFDEKDITCYTEDIRRDMIHNDSPSKPEDSKYDSIIRDRLRGVFYGVTNAYLTEVLLQQNIQVGQVVGENDVLLECDCCNYKTIYPGEDGVCQICPVCFWENFGEGPNHMTLIQAQKNFNTYGAMDRKFLDAIDPEAKKKYEKIAIK